MPPHLLDSPSGPVRLLALATHLAATLLWPKAQADDWQLVREDDFTHVYSRPQAHSEVRAVKAETQVAGSVRELAAFMLSSEAYPHWVPYGKSARALERAPAGALVHFTLAGNWPFLARDAIALITVTPLGDQGIQIRFQSEPWRMPKQKGVVRIEVYSGLCQLQAAGAHLSSLHCESHLEPGGHMPAWLANRIAVDTTFDALSNLRTLLPAHPATSESSLRAPETQFLPLQ